MNEIKYYEKIAFVILHYMNLEDTIKCVESIENKLNNKQCELVIVDNASTNNTGRALKNIYKDNFKIHVIENTKNLGFANGNNVGYLFAKNTLKSDFIIMINNDTEMIQADFVEEIISLYNKYQYHVLGPDIITRDNIHQNPIIPFEYNINSINKALFKYKILILLNVLRLDEKLLTFINRRKRDNKIENEKKSEVENVKLHGSCWIFSPIYIKELDGIYNETYLFLEEDILYYIAQKMNFKLLYSKRLKILHKEDGATDYILKSNKQKRKFVYKNHYLSYKAFKKIINLDKIDAKYFGINNNVIN